jgi:type I restriction-modification system DNA methylase subunit
MERMSMNKTFEQGRDEIAKLCRYFETNQQAFLAPGVKEAHVRQSLIDPFFEALGWDVRNTAQVAPQYREVIPEDSLDVEGHQKAPDYTFRIGTLPKFYAEAKKCGVNINADPAPAYQLRRYGWSARVALSLLTDFEELGIYDCTLRPHPNDKASRARIQYFCFEEYPDRWRELWDKFSRDAVWSGAFDQFAASKRKRGTSEVDAEFLKEIEGWRDVLARNIALRNPNLSSDDLNAAVQRTIDRIVFLRMAEDRGIEPYEQLMKLCERPDIYPRFMRDLCRKADEKYNSGLFHFQKEEGVSEPPDRLTPRLMLDDKVFKPILQGLYFSHGSPYHFGVLPVEILGTVYERFLGKVIRLTAGHQAKVEPKPEVRKAGGVYYTPSYIVDYIVKNTVGKQIEGKSPTQLAGGNPPKADKPPFRVLDMACGSGSFLLGAYRLLLDHCLKWYMENNPKKHPTAVQQNQRTGEWRLMIEEKKRILTTHIFGVDIDSQAVEVTKLSLLLKVLEGETSETIHEDFLISKKRALPNLADNIKSGNSLIGSDYFTGTLFPDPDELKRVNPFDWKQGFPDAMKSGGFDCVIGNPPYVRQETLGAGFKDYANRHYRVYHGIADLYAYFIERGVSLLRPDGLFSYIVANKWMRANYGEPLRKWLKEQEVEEIIDFGDLPVFKGATTYPCIIRIRKSHAEAQRHREDISIVKMDTLNFTDLQEYALTKRYLVRRETLDDKGWSLSDERTRMLIAKIRAAGIPLGEYIKGKIYRGVLTGLNEAFVIDGSTRERLIAEDPNSAEIIKPFLAGKDIKRYQTLQTENYLIFARHGIDIKKYPAIERYLNQFKTRLMPKPKDWKGKEWPGRKPGTYQWYEIQDTIDYYQEFEKPKIVYAEIATQGQFTLDFDALFSDTTSYIMGSDSEYLLGILNSKLFTFLFSNISSEIRGGFYRWKRQYMCPIPIRMLDLSNSTDKNIHDKFVKMVISMLALHKQLATANSVAQKEIIKRQIDATDAEIDRLVYELYNLTPEEIAIVEGLKNNV